MIGQLKGIIAMKAADHVICDVNGVGYAVFVHSRQMAALAEGEAATLIIETHVREDHIHLYGFANTAEREWFKALTSIERVGSRMGLTILGALTPAQIVQAVLAQDTHAFTQISGVGPKLGDRMILELKNKVAKLPIDGAIPVSADPATASGKGKKSNMPAAKSAPSHQEDAISALANMGYTRSDALRAVMAASSNLDASASLDDVITASLREV